MDTSPLEEKIAALKDEQEKIQLSIIQDTNKIEMIQQGLKFSNKRLKGIDKELEFYEVELERIKGNDISVTISCLFISPVLD